MPLRPSNFRAIILPGLCLVIGALWIRSHWRNDAISELATPTSWAIQSNDGGLTFTHRRYKGVHWDHAVWNYYSGPAFDPGFTYEPWGFTGFHHASIQGTQAANTATPAYTFHDDRWTIPYWFPLAASAFVPALRLARRSRRWVVRRRRTRNGQCLACGYDLRESPSKCPECGTPCTAGMNDQSRGALHSPHPLNPRETT